MTNERDPNASDIMKIYLDRYTSVYSYHLGMDYQHFTRSIATGRRTIILLPVHWKAWLQTPTRSEEQTLPEGRTAIPQPGDTIAFSVGMPKVRLHTIVSVKVRTLTEPLSAEILAKLDMTAEDFRARWKKAWNRRVNGSAFALEGGPWPLDDCPEVYEIEWEDP